MGRALLLDVLDYEHLILLLTHSVIMIIILVSQKEKNIRSGYFRRYSLWAKSLEIGSKDYCKIRG